MPASAYQKRVTGGCPNHQTISAVAADGSVTCAGAVIPIDVGGILPSDQTLAVGNLRIEGICGVGRGVSFYNAGSDPATLNWFYSSNTTRYANGIILQPGIESVDSTFSFGGDRIEGQFIFHDAVSTITVNLHAVDISQAPARCEVLGTAVFAPTGSLA